MPSSLTTKTYTIDEVAQRLRVNPKTARIFCLETDCFKAVKIGNAVQVQKESFDHWIGSDSVYTVNEITTMLGMNKRTVYNYCYGNPEFRVLRVASCLRIPQKDFDDWLGLSDCKQEDL